MTLELDPRMEAAARRRLTELYDAIEVGPPPVADSPSAGRHDEPGTVVDLGIVRPTPPSTARRTAASRRPWLAVAAAVALLAASAVILGQLGAGDNPPASDDTTPTQVPTHLVPDWLPDGVELTSENSELPLSPEDTGPGRTTITVFGDTTQGDGDAPADDPFAEIDLAILVVRDETIGLGGEPTTTVRGHEASTGDDPSGNDVGIAGGPDDVHWLTWDETTEVEVTMASRTLDTTTLEEMAPLLVLDGDHASFSGLLDGVPGEFEEIGFLDDVTFGGATYVTDTADGYFDAYSPPLDQYDEHVATEEAARDWRVLTVSSAQDGGGDDLGVVRWMTGGQPIELRGTSGWILEETNLPDDLGASIVVFWQESGGQLNIVCSINLTADEVQRFVEGLHS